MNVAIFGMGYVGTVTSACLAVRGHVVCGVDTNEAKLMLFSEGKSPIVEPGLDELIGAAFEGGRLRVVSEAEEGMRDADVSIVCVGTPSMVGGRPNLKAVKGVAKAIAVALSKRPRRHEVMFRSTMPPGSTRGFVEEEFGDLIASGLVRVYFAPEFLREGSALRDFEKPSLSVLGCANVEEGEASLAFTLLPGQPELVSWEEAEMVKYACNFWHAVKVGFGNEVGRLSVAAGLDGRRVMEVFCRDTELNISERYLRPGNPFGGSCLPKDVLALVSQARQAGVSAPLLENTMATNAAHTEFLLTRVERHDARRVAILGLTFKPSTDDLRNSPMIAVTEALMSDGIEVRIHDPLLKMEGLTGTNLRQTLYRLPYLDDLLVEQAGDVIDWADLVIAFHPCVRDEVIRRHARPELIVLDVNGWDTWSTVSVQYEGLCW